MLALFAAALVTLPADADEVTSWNQVVTDAAAKAKMFPLDESRTFAIMHIAVHDALNAIDHRYAQRYPRADSAPEALPEVAVAVAAHATLIELMPASKAVFDAALQKKLSLARDGKPKQLAIELGGKAAAQTLALRRGDGASETVTVEPGKRPGEYRPTPPELRPALFGQWGRITPFALKSGAQFRPVAPFKVTSAVALAEVEEVKAVGGAASTVRTPEQSEIARYWYEKSPQGWNRIAREIAATRKLDPWENARLFALVNVAMADGFIAGFEAKYHYYYWRPVTSIRAAGDAGWTSFLPAPPVPDYPSTHTVLGAAAATVMARFFGTDYVSFSMRCEEAPYAGITRKFWSLSEAARENGASRVFAGIHFRNAVDAGYVQGQKVGDWVYDHVLAPEKSRPAPSSTAAR